MSEKKLKGKLRAVEIDYDSVGTPPAVRQLKALLYKEGHTYFVWPGTGPHNVHYGFGDNAQEAMDDFQRNYSRKVNVKKAEPEPIAQTVAPVTASASLKEKLFANLPFISENTAITFVERLLKRKGDPI